MAFPAVLNVQPEIERLPRIAAVRTLGRAVHFSLAEYSRCSASFSSRLAAVREFRTHSCSSLDMLAVARSCRAIDRLLWALSKRARALNPPPLDRSYGFPIVLLLSKNTL